MALIGLVDVDGHNFPNLALMRISAWHKAQGDTVEWWQGNLFYYDKVYMSKIFSDAYSKEKDAPINCGEVVQMVIAPMMGTRAFVCNGCGADVMFYGAERDTKKAAEKWNRRTERSET